MERDKGGVGMTSVSIIIPCRNRAKNISKCIASILKQGYKDYEIIVCDYGGGDKTEEILKRFNDERIRYIHIAQYGRWNLSRARNIGIRESKGELILSLDADMLLGERVLEELWDYFKEHGKKFIYQIQRTNIKEDGTFESMPVNTFLGDFQATHRDNFFKVRGFDEKLDMYGYEDLDIVVRLGRIGVKQYWLPNLKLYHQWHPMSPGNETYINMIRSKLNRSHLANDKNWGSSIPKGDDKRYLDRFLIWAVIKPIKAIKKGLRLLKSSHKPLNSQ